MVGPRLRDPRVTPAAGQAVTAGRTFQEPEHAQVEGVELLARLGPLGRLQDHRDRAETRVVDDVPERLQAQMPAADPRVAIDPAPAFATAVVQVPDPNPSAGRRPGPVRRSSHRTLRPSRTHTPPRKYDRCRRRRRAAPARRRESRIAPRCSKRWPRQVPCPAVVSRSIRTATPRVRRWTSSIAAGDPGEPLVLARPDVGPGVGHQVADPQRLGTARPRRSSRRSTCSRGHRRGWRG